MSKLKSSWPGDDLDGEHMTVIFHKPTSEYLYVQDGHAYWTRDPVMAHGFKRSAAENYMTHNFPNVCPDKDPAQIELIDLDAGELEQDGCLKFSSQEEAEEALSRLEVLIDPLSGLDGTVRDLLQFYTCMRSQADLEQEDLLHKIELDDGGPEMDAELCRTLRETRRRRRKYKDICHALSLFNSSGITVGAANLRRLLHERNEYMEGRFYTPRVLVDLFHEGNGDKQDVAS